MVLILFLNFLTPALLHNQGKGRFILSTAVCYKTTYFEIDFYRISDVAKSFFGSNLIKLSLDLSKEVLYDSVGQRAAK